MIKSALIILAISFYTIILSHAYLILDRPYHNRQLDEIKRDMLADKFLNLYSGLEETESSQLDCNVACRRNARLAPKSCECRQSSSFSSSSASSKKKLLYPIDCQVLCFIGQGGKACNCNYAAFVGKK
ncbi:unnamed protein product [Brachionus calyciflorus]|uniref:Uncharacterized protein n=1 Tax=Brachionus calyciflorus TaxID=104777 RepID=A0A813RSL0_9BILA|nr:unnamed protein product [Brachionus calyciflorus]